jgi:type IV pilus assembly protein PilX
MIEPLKTRWVIHRQFRYSSQQRGSTLLVGVILLIVLMLLGVSAATMSSLDERMARNLRDRDIAFQAAEAALRDARQDITQTRKLNGFRGFPLASGAGTCNTAGEDGNAKGLCRPAKTGNPVWSILADNSNNARFVTYGGVTGAEEFNASSSTGVTDQPRYLIEVLPDLMSSDGLSSGGGAYGAPKAKVLYRITALGFGSNSGTSALLQEVIRP